MGWAAETREINVDLPALGKTDESHIRQQLELQFEPAFLALHAFLSKTRCLVRGRLEVGVALAADAAFGHDKGLSQLGKIDQDFSGFKIFNNGSGRNNHFQILCAAAGAVVAGTMSAVLGDLMLLVFQIQEGMVTLGSAENDVAALAAVAAVGTAFGNKLLPPETDAARSAVSGLDIYFCFINKFHKKKRFP